MQEEYSIAYHKDNKVDIGVAGISITPEREEEVAFTQSYAISNQVVIILDEEIKTEE